jgi:hypothetical protein
MYHTLLICPTVTKTTLISLFKHLKEKRAIVLSVESLATIELSTLPCYQFKENPDFFSEETLLNHFDFYCMALSVGFERN